MSLKITTKYFVQDILYHIITSKNIMTPRDDIVDNRDFNNFDKLIENNIFLCDEWLKNKENIKLLSEYENTETEDVSDLKEDIFDLAYDMFPILSCVYGEDLEKIIKIFIDFLLNTNQYKKGNDTV